MTFDRRLQRYLRRSAARGRDAVRVGPFTAFVHPDDPLRYFNYAVPEEGAAFAPDDAAALAEAFAARGRAPRRGDRVPDAGDADTRRVYERAGFAATSVVLAYARGLSGAGYYPGTLMAANPRVTPERSREALDGTFPGDLGIELVEIDDERVVGRLAVDRRHLHPGGYVHGGVWTAFADTVAAWGTMRNLPAGEDFTTVELKVNVFAAGRDGDELIGIGEPLHIGRRTQVWEVRVHNGERLAANFVCTQMVLPERS